MIFLNSAEQCSGNPLPDKVSAEITFQERKKNRKLIETINEKMLTETGKKKWELMDNSICNMCST